ncbi:MAG: hypothetical protein GY853_16910 [PVC group bacterium]|nr:hypothetical protein [PVC group bacterium]
MSLETPYSYAKGEHNRYMLDVPLKDGNFTIVYVWPVPLSENKFVAWRGFGYFIGTTQEIIEEVGENWN